MQRWGDYYERARGAVEEALPFIRSSDAGDVEGKSHSPDQMKPAKYRRILKTFVLPAALLLLVLSVIHYWISGGSASYSPVDQTTATKHLVIASFSSQNVSWLDQVPSDWKVFRYLMDDPNPPSGLPVPRNNGRESMAYLTYMIDNYDKLGDFIVFTHGHYRSWHQPEPLPAKIRALNLTALDEENYISFRCEDNMGCERQPYLDTLKPNWEGESHLREFWHHIMPHEELPRIISYKCCAQHATTKRAIRAHSKNDWTRMRSPMLRDQAELEAAEAWARGPPAANEWIFGMYFEKLWHVLLGQGGEYCPSVEVCRQRHFSNAIICDSDMDFTMFEGTMWQGVKCKTAFDDVPPNEQANITEFHQKILGYSAELRSAKAEAMGVTARAVSAYDVYPPAYLFLPPIKPADGMRRDTDSS